MPDGDVFGGDLGAVEVKDNPVASLGGARDADFETWRAAMLKWQGDCEQQIALRDQFAAAALTGLLANHPVYGSDHAPKRAYELADAMLRERGNHLEKPNGSTDHDATPVAWAVMYPNNQLGILAFFWREAYERAGENDRIVPLYRNPKLTLTDAERRAITALLDRLHVNDAIDVELTATLRGLLERLGAANYGDDRRSVGGE